MRFAENNAEIVHRNALPFACNDDRCGSSELVYRGVVGLDRVEVQNEVDIHTLQHVELDIVDDIVANHNVNVCGNLCVRRGKALAEAVVMHHEVVYADNSVVAEYLLAEIVNEAFVGSGAEQGVGCFDNELDSRIDNKQCNCTAEPAVEHNIGRQSDNASYNNHRRRNNVVYAVSRRCNKRGRAYLLSCRAVDKTLKELQNDRRRKNNNAYNGVFRLRGEDYFFDGAEKQVEAYGCNEAGHDKPREVFHSCVAERVLGVGGLSRDLEAEKGNKRRAGVAQIIDRVGGNGYA